MSAKDLEKQNLFDLFDFINNNNQEILFNYPNNLINSENSFSQSEIIFGENCHFLCECKKIPFLIFYLNWEIKYLCKCKQEKMPFEKLFENLYISEENDDKELKCKEHLDEKYNHYCKTCNENLCRKCINDHEHVGHEINYIGFENAVNKSQYIKEKENERNDFEKIIPSLDEDTENFNSEKINDEIYSNGNNIENEKSKINDFLIQKKEIFLGEEEKKEINKILNDREKLLEKDELIKRLFNIILFDLDNYPNYNLLKTISNLEMFAVLYYKDYNEIILHYKFNEENIKDNKVVLFGDKFVNNNKENCFLIINGKNIVELNRFIDLKDIYEKIPKEAPLSLKVQLIERKRKVMTDLSFMFYNISTITDISYSSNYDSGEVRNMSYMFYNCQSTCLPNFIEKFNTINVIDMSYMFYNCSLVKQIPDISKWDVRFLKKANNMFENCLSLSIFPDILNWKMINIEQMNYMFKNCKSLQNLPDTLDMNTNDKVEMKGIFEGTKLSEEKNNEDNMVLKCSKNIVYGIYYILEKIFVYKCIAISTIICYIITVILPFFIPLFFFPFYSLYRSFQLDFINESIYNPKKYFNYTNYENISNDYFDYFINKCFKIMNLTTREKIFESEIDDCVDILFNNINEKYNLEANQLHHKLYNFSILAIFIIIIIIVLIICSDIKRDYINFRKDFILSILMLLLIPVALVLELLDYFLIDKLRDSFSKFYFEAKILFGLKSFYHSNENDKFRDSTEAIIISWVFSLFSCIFLFPIVSFLNKEKKDYDNSERRLLKINKYKNKSLFIIFIEIGKNSFIYKRIIMNLCISYIKNY